MDQLKMPKDLQRNITWASEQCELHKRPVLKMIIDDKLICPRCELDKANEEFEKKIQDEVKREQADSKYGVLFRDSVIEDATLLNARLDTYITEEQEERENKQMVQSALKDYLNDEVFNLVLQGNPGAGKSHLAYSVLHDLNETKQYSCLFVSVETMLRRIKATFNDKSSRYTEEYFNQLLSDVDFLVLDDLGAETGAITTDKTATNFVQKVLYGIATSRQNKATILTTNLKSETLFNMYDKKLVSRLLKNPRIVVFKTTKDKRINKLPF